MNIVVNSIAPGAVGFFQVKIWDAAYTSYEVQAAAGRVGTGLDYSAENNIFSMTTGASIAYPQIYNGGGTTWTAVGNENVGALLVTVWPGPEPAQLTLAALAAAAFLVRRRRTNSLTA